MAAADEEETEQPWHLASPAEPGRPHLTTQREEESERYRVTFEANQLVTGFLNPQAEPKGHVLKGLLIVPGAHASLDNISPSGLWLEDEVWHYSALDNQKPVDELSCVDLDERRIWACLL